jgi:hypothetical protein
MRLKIQQLFYYDIDGIPIAIFKSKDECYNNIHIIFKIRQEKKL